MVLKITTKTLARDRKYRIRDWTLALKFWYISIEERAVKKKRINWYLTRLREEGVMSPLHAEVSWGSVFLQQKKPSESFRLSVGFRLTLKALSPKSNGYWKLYSRESNKPNFRADDSKLCIVEFSSNGI